ncbi:MAG: thiolase family protein [Solirubrobacterales bacterium]|nr:thiolase family protein [Solirubrobacterales bacterium]
MTEACLIAALRTPVGRLGGTLAPVRPDDLAAHVLGAALELTGVEATHIDEVFLGCANQAGEDNRNVARMAGLLAGLPVSVPGVTVNRLCGSGLEAVAQAARAIQTGDAQLVLAGGVESMTRAPWIIEKPARAYPTGPPQTADSSLGWRLVNSRMEALGHTDPLGITAENLAEQYSISRSEQDEFALLSHRKAAASSRRLTDEIVPVQVDLGKKRGKQTIDADEGPRPDSSLEGLSKLKPAFKQGGSVTAGNSSPLNDGAACVVLASREYAEAHGLTVTATVRSIASAGVPPRIMGIGPVPATQKALNRAGLQLDQIQLIELNEAFAAQALAVLREWGIAAEDPRLNVNGGAIALGHPLGCSGARLVTTLVHEFAHRPDARFALATMCIGVGQGVAMVLERG